MYELTKVYKKIVKRGLTETQITARLDEACSKIENIKDLIKKSLQFDERKHKIKHTSRPKTKEQISQIIEDLGKYDKYV